uniref:Uncharacterized protein n=1 Tax=Oryza nivara TaxID=4536 RepID=A0A0E0FM30_ORYNI
MSYISSISLLSIPSHASIADASPTTPCLTKDGGVEQLGGAEPQWDGEVGRRRHWWRRERQAWWLRGLELGHRPPEPPRHEVFSNGLNIPDIINEHLGAEPTLPYLSPDLRGAKLLVGANFASASVSILNDTGIQFVNIVRMSRQLQFFAEYHRRGCARWSARRGHGGS